MSSDVDEEDERIWQPCSCDNCGHVTVWASVIANNVWNMAARGIQRSYATCEVCGSARLRPGVTLPAPRMRQ